MAKIALRRYHEQIEALFQENRLLEVIAHCRHILSQHPRHVATYRLLGKALLERGDFMDAADVFQRVLSADPEDFIAHIGMAIVYKEQGRMPIARWHMERAFEMDPYNNVIQQELRDLYGRRDGQRPARLMLTREALARLYVKGGLYQQAVAELRQARERDAKRVDLQVLLAEALWRDEQRVDAVDVCLQLLDVLPDSIKANAILAEVWLLTGRLQEAQDYLEKVQEMLLLDLESLDPNDPAGIAFRLPGAKSLPDVLMITMMDDEAIFAADIADTAGWVAELGLGAAQTGAPDDAELAEQVPDWLLAMEQNDEVRVAVMQEEELADWFAAAEATEARSAAAERPDQPEDEYKELDGVFDEDLAALLATGDEIGLTDDGWAASEELAEAVLAFDPALGQDEDIVISDPTNMPAWLLNLTSPFDDDDLEPGEDEDRLAGTGEAIDAATEEADWKAWLEADEAAAAPPAGEPALSVDEPLPDWLAFMDETAAAENAPAGEELPDWLGVVDEAVVADAPAGEELPGWLAFAGDEPASAPETAPQFAAQSLAPARPEPPDDADQGEGAGVLAGVAGLAAAGLAAAFAADDDEPEEPAVPEEDDTRPVAMAAAGVAGAAVVASALGDESEVEPVVDEAMALSAADMFDLEDSSMSGNEEQKRKPDEEPEDAAAVPEDLDAALAWLEELAAAQGAPLEELPSLFDAESPVTTDDVYPDWLNEMAETSPPAGASALEPAEIPDWLRETVALPEEDSLLPAGSSDDLGWLDQIAAGGGPAIEEPLTLSWDKAEEPPAEDKLDWLDALTTDPGLEIPPVDMGDAAATVPDIELPVTEWAADLADTRPEDEFTTDQMPDDVEQAMAWLDDLAAQAEGESAEAGAAGLDWLDTLEAEPLPDEALYTTEAADLLGASVDEVPEDLDEAMAWLEQLSIEPEAPDSQPGMLEAAMAAEVGLSEPAGESAAEVAGPDLREELTETLPDELHYTAEAIDLTPVGYDDAPEDLDEAMAWLEQLAARQGAPLDELPTVSERPVGAAAFLDEPESEEAPAEEVAEEVAMVAAVDDLLAAEEAGPDQAVDDVPDDLDEAMAWLEQLAARQGAPLEELPTVDALPDEVLTPAGLADDVPEDPDEALAWLEMLAVEQLAAAATSEAEEPDLAEGPMVVEEPPTPMIPHDVVAAQAEAEAALLARPEPAAPETIEAGVPATPGDILDEIPDDPDAAMAWLEQLAARQGASLDELPTVDMVPEEVTMPGWMAREVAAEAAAEATAAAAAEAEAEAAAKAEAAAAAKAAAEAAAKAAAEAAAKAEAEAAAKAAAEAAAEPAPPAVEETLAAAIPAMEPDAPLFAAAEVAEPEPELEPDYGMFMVSEAEVQARDAARPGGAAADEFVLDEEIAASLPDWLSLELAGEDSDMVIDWTETELNVTGWLTAEDEVRSQEKVVMERPAAPVPAPRPEPAHVPAPAARPAAMAPTAAFAEARQALRAGDVPQALQRYQAHLDSGDDLPALIHELETAEVDRGSRPGLRRLLGDAYMRNGQLQEALDIYREALEAL